MDSARDLRKRPLAELMDDCRRQASPATRTRGQGSACLEIFRRAIEEKDPAAWSFIEEQYRRLVMRWVRGAAATPLSIEDLEDLIQETFLKFWRTIGRQPEKFNQKFNHIGSVLRYLQQCAASACIDYHRHLNRQQIVEESLQNSSEKILRSGFHLEKDRELAQQLEKLRAWVENSVEDELERLIILHSFYDGWSPKKIFRQYPAKFSEIDQVRKIKIRVMKRAKRAFRK